MKMDGDLESTGEVRALLYTIYLGSIVDFCQFWEVSKEVPDGLAALRVLRKKVACTPGP